MRWGLLIREAVTACLHKSTQIALLFSYPKGLDLLAENSRYRFAWSLPEEPPGTLVFPGDCPLQPAPNKVEGGRLSVQPTFLAEKEGGYAEGNLRFYWVLAAQEPAPRRRRFTDPLAQNPLTGGP